MGNLTQSILKSLKLGEVAVINLISSLTKKIGLFLPNLVGAILILITGFLLAKFVKKAANKIFAVIGLNFLIEKSGVNQILTGFGFQKKAEELFISLIYLIIILLSIIAAAEILGIKIVLQSLNIFIDYLPKIFGSLFIFVIITYLGKLAKQFIINLSNNYKIEQGRYIGIIIEILIITFAIIIALNKLGFDTTIFTTNITMILTIFLGSCGLAISLGGKDIASKIIAGLYLNNLFHAGNEIEFGNLKGKIINIGITTTKIETINDEKIYIPNDKLLQEIIRSKN